MKGLYGLYIDFDSIPRVHNISFVINCFADKLPQSVTQEQFKFFNILSRYYFNDRYPDSAEDAFEDTQEGDVQKMFDKTKEVFSWLQTLKP